MRNPAFGAVVWGADIDAREQVWDCFDGTILDGPHITIGDDYPDPRSGGAIANVKTQMRIVLGVREERR